MQIIRKLGLFVFILMLLVVSSCTKQLDSPYFEVDGNTMGTTYSIKVVKSKFADNDLLFAGLQFKIDSVLAVVNQQMSTYIDSSEISLFNKAGSDEWITVSPDLAFVLSKADEISSKSKGAFDITIGPLVNVWGFGPILKVYDIPAEDEITKAKSNVGYHKLSVRMVPPSVMKNDAKVYCDLSAIAKGFGVDKVAELFNFLKIENYLVEIGGEIRTKGTNHSGKPWQIGISTPDSEYGIEKVVSVSNKSMATSGDYRNYFEKDNVRYSHTIDSRTGYPIKHKLASVTVIHDSCVVADAYATAIDVLGPVEGYNLAIKERLPVFLIIRSEDGFIEKMTPEFQNYLNIVQK